MCQKPSLIWLSSQRVKIKVRLRFYLQTIWQEYFSKIIHIVFRLQVLMAVGLVSWSSFRLLGEGYPLLPRPPIASDLPSFMDPTIAI